MRLKKTTSKHPKLTCCLLGVFKDIVKLSVKLEITQHSSK